MRRGALGRRRRCRGQVRRDERDVVEEGELAGEVVGVAGAGGRGEVAEQVENPFAVGVGRLAYGAAGLFLGAGLDERAAVIPAREDLSEQVKDPKEPVLGVVVAALKLASEVLIP